MAEVNLPYGFTRQTNSSLDTQYLNGNVTYLSVETVNNTIDKSVRYIGLTVNINNEEYWYKNGVENIDLILKQPSVDSPFDDFSVSTGHTYSSQKIENTFAKLGDALLSELQISDRDGNNNVTITPLTGNIIEWRINQIIHELDTSLFPVIFNIPNATDEYKRKDLIYLNVNGFGKIQGTEDKNIASEPQLPPVSIRITVIDIDGNSATPIPVPQPDLSGFLTKTDAELLYTKKLLGNSFANGRFLDIPNGNYRYALGSSSGNFVTGPFYIKIPNSVSGSSVIQLHGTIMVWGGSDYISHLNFRIVTYTWHLGTKNWAHGKIYLDNYAGTDLLDLPVSFGNILDSNGDMVIRLGDNTYNWNGFEIDIQLKEVMFNNLVISNNSINGWSITRSLPNTFYPVINTGFIRTNMLTPNYFLGVYITLTSLQLAHPVGQDGQYALIDIGVGEDSQMAIWDSNDVKWVIVSGTAKVVSVNSQVGEVVLDSDDILLNGISSSEPTTGGIIDGDSITDGLNKLQNNKANLLGGNIFGGDQILLNDLYVNGKVSGGTFDFQTADEYATRFYHNPVDSSLNVYSPNSGKNTKISASGIDTETIKTDFLSVSSDLLGKSNIILGGGNVNFINTTVPNSKATNLIASTTPLTGGTSAFVEVPNESGVLALKSDIPSPVDISKKANLDISNTFSGTTNNFLGSVQKNGIDLLPKVHGVPGVKTINGFDVAGYKLDVGAGDTFDKGIHIIFPLNYLDGTFTAYFSLNLWDAGDFKSYRFKVVIYAWYWVGVTTYEVKYAVFLDADGETKPNITINYGLVNNNIALVFNDAGWTQNTEVDLLLTEIMMANVSPSNNHTIGFTWGSDFPAGFTSIQKTNIGLGVIPQDISGKANLDGGNTFTGPQVFNNNIVVADTGADAKITLIGADDKDISIEYAGGYSNGVGFRGSSGPLSILKFNTFNGQPDRVYDFPNLSGTVALLSDIPSLSGYALKDGSNVNAGSNWNINSATATKLLSGRTINGVSFDGTADITIYDSTKQTLIPHLEYDLIQKSLCNKGLSSDNTNTFFGAGANIYPNSGYINTGFGYRALENITSGNFNTSLGAANLTSITSGSFNIGVGVTSLANITSSASNIGIGTSAGTYLNDNVTQLTSVSSSIFIGTYTTSLNVGDDNQIVIGYDANGNGTNTVTIGNDNIIKTILKGTVSASPATDYNHLVTKAQLDLKANLAGGNSFTGNQNIDGDITSGSSAVRYGDKGVSVSYYDVTIFDDNQQSHTIFNNTGSIKKKNGEFDAEYTMLFPSIGGTLALTSDFGAGKTIGATARNATKWNEITFRNIENYTTPFYVMGWDLASGDWMPTKPTAIMDFVGIGNGSTLANDISGSAANSYTSESIISNDDRIISPSDNGGHRLKFTFTTWNNDNGSPYADSIHLNSYGDGSGGNSNLISFNKSTIGMRIWQGGFNSTSPYSNYKDIAFTDGSNIGVASFRTNLGLGVGDRVDFGGVNISNTFNGNANINFIPNGTGDQWELYPTSSGFLLYNRTQNKYPISIGSTGGFSSFGNEVLTAGNYNSYSPTLTGIGAYGVWNINIYGNAVNATNAVYSQYSNYLLLHYTGDLNLVTESGVYRQESPTSGYNYTSTLNMSSSDGRQQMTIERGGAGMKFRGSEFGSGDIGWSNWNEVYHSGNISTAKTGLGLGSAAYLDATNYPYANTVVQYDANGYLNANFIRTPVSAASPISSGVISLYGNNDSNGYHYAVTAAGVKTFIGLGDGSTLNNNITGNAATATYVEYTDYAGTANSASNWGVQYQTNDFATPNYFMVGSDVENDGSWGYATKSDVKITLGLGDGSTLNNNISGNAVTASNAISSTYSYYINSPDGSRIPNDILPQNNPNRVRFDFANAGATGTGGDYAGVMTYSPWAGTTSSTGDASYQLVFGSTASNGGGVPMLKIRKGIDTTWNEWYDVYSAGKLINIHRPEVGNQIMLAVGEPSYLATDYGINLRGHSGTAQFTWNNIHNGIENTSPIMAWSRVSGNVGIGGLASNEKLTVYGEGNVFVNAGFGYGFKLLDGFEILRQNGYTQFNYGSGTQMQIYDGSVNVTGILTSTKSIIYQSSNGAIDWLHAGLEVRGTNPSIAFHYPGSYGGNLWMDNTSVLKWDGHGLTTNRLSAGYDSGVAGSVNASSWFRSIGSSGWYNSTYGGGIYMEDTTWVRVYDGKAFLVDNTVSATDFYATNQGYMVSDYGIGLVGLYNSTKYQAVFSMGSQYKPAIDGTSLSNHYGIAWSYPGLGQSKTGLSHQALFVEAGVTKTAIGTGIWTIGDIYAGGYVTATGGAGTSDIRHKNVIDFNRDLSWLDADRTIAFTWKNAKDIERVHYGYSAQDIDQFAPELVFKNDPEKYSLNQTELLVLEVKRLKQRITELERSIN